ncbi:enoyl-CoA hydratase/isomerase family protein [Niabella sp. W65]|nr:enoyl-CoA hydratase/isomerase family protein [Niabella sp. W65]MCH7368302.1 enoyl-CoA hydratase/isomerase family protein [Niabella sp. W65]ULT43901.1 enoyl-CoA hydratase/isomerase family protein [Niabella sp. I65]
MPADVLLFDVQDHIAVITINRPDKLNALNKSVFDELDRLVDAVIERPDIRSAIITGAGTKLL